MKPQVFNRMPMPRQLCVVLALAWLMPMVSLAQSSAPSSKSAAAPQKSSATTQISPSPDRSLVIPSNGDSSLPTEKVQIQPDSTTTTSPGVSQTPEALVQTETVEARRQTLEQRQNNVGQVQVTLESKWQHMDQYSTSLGTAYRAEDLKTTLTSTREELLRNLEGEDLAGLRDYVRNAFPKAPNGIDTGNMYGPVVPLEEARDFLKLIDQFLGKVKSASVKTVDLQIVTVPKEARAILSVSDGAPDRETITDNTIPNLYRGRYSYVITKNGYKNALGPLDLVDNPGTILECQMVLIADSSNFSQCRQK